MCKRFRRIACESPSLWTKLEFYTEPCSTATSKPCHHSLDLTRCQLQIEQSQFLPLPLFLYRAGLCEPAKSLLRALGTQAHRWENPHLYLPDLRQWNAEKQCTTTLTVFLPASLPSFDTLRRIEYLEYGKSGLGLPLGSILNAASLSSLVALKITDLEGIDSIGRCLSTTILDSRTTAKFCCHSYRSSPW